MGYRLDESYTGFIMMWIFITISEFYNEGKLLIYCKVIMKNLDYTELKAKLIEQLK